MQRHRLIPSVVGYFGAALIGLNYLLPSSYLFEEDLRQKLKLRNVVVTQEITLYDSSLPNGEIRFQETVYTELPATGRGHVRIESRYPTAVNETGAATTTQLRLLVSDLSRTVEQWRGQSRSLPELPLNETPLLFYTVREVGPLTARLQSLGVDLSIRQIDRLGGKVVYRVGAKDSGSCLWFDKELMHPLGMSLQSKQQGRIQVSWEATPAYNDDVYYPQEIVTSIDGRPLEKRRLLNIRVNQQLQPELFNFPNPPTAKPDATPAELLERIVALRSRLY